MSTVPEPSPNFSTKWYSHLMTYQPQTNTTPGSIRTFSTACQKGWPLHCNSLFLLWLPWWPLTSFLGVLSLLHPSRPLSPPTLEVLWAPFSVFNLLPNFTHTHSFGSSSPPLSPQFIANQKTSGNHGGLNAGLQNYPPQTWQKWTKKKQKKWEKRLHQGWNHGTTLFRHKRRFK